MMDQPESEPNADRLKVTGPSRVTNPARVVYLLLALFICGPLASAQSQTPTKPPASPPTKASPTVVPTGTIKGRVVADDGRVLSNTTVMARAINGTPTGNSTRVDSEGRFAFDDLPAAVYLVSATAPGYIDNIMTQGDPRQWQTYLIGSQVRVNLIKGGVITGVITNQKGQPVVGVPVRASSLNQGGNMVLRFGGGVSETDDRGVYRIYGLPPGQYTVDAGGSGPFGRFAPSGYDLDIQTYYPSSNRDTAVPVSVMAGEETTAIDIKYKGTEGRTISGIVTGKLDAAGISSGISVMLSHAGTTSMVGVATVGATDQNRPFGFDGVADGEYDLLASLFAGPTESVAAATKRVTVRGGDLTGVELVLAQMATMSGNITLHPIKPEDKCDKRGSQLIETLMEVQRDAAKKGDSSILSMMFSGFGTALSVNGDFSVRNLEAGSYRFGVKLPTDAWYVRAIKRPSARDPQISAGTAGRTTRPTSFWQGTMLIKTGENINGVSVLVGQDAAGLRGQVVTTPEGSSVPANLRVHLVPVEREESANVLRYLEAGVESSGAFAFTNIAPGRYFIILRFEQPATTEAPQRPIAFDATAREGLRREAEALNNSIELKPCQRLVDVPLKLKPAA